ncbi:EAL domain-containing protein [Ornithinibacillus halophilus]|uniref:PAS domain S-box-containing protein/diguanylate cyclase (GGDEF) domain-containing protein n=1 Tax=Ornithinibacillus halophilus TaxID=930117 RepID=A0A1M5NZA1_9BACI|nr:EAL domain-containing protein [Ornithinibacillus halophilus]SHG94828.1 PAS domain S-box-containing protein/diguanylate cyclase (GGDEF) domain-containing protein [Ornithinibacillus halophilus]
MHHLHHATYSPFLIILSIIIAFISSYTTLVLVERVSESNHRSRKITWIFIGVFIMGVGIFSTHFIGMLAYHLNYPMTFNGSLLVLSFLFSLITSFTAFYLLYTHPLTKGKIFISGVIIGLGIVFLHYTATYGIYESVEIHFTSIYFTLSIVLAIIISSIAIRIFVNKKGDSISNRTTKKNIVSALVLGGAITTMHYVGMEAIYINKGSDVTSNGADKFIGNIVSFSTLFLMFATLFTAYLDYRSTHSEKQLIKQLKESEKRYRQLVEKSPVPVIIHDGNTIVFVNEIVLSMVKASEKHEIVGKSFINFIHPDFRETVKKRMQIIKEKGHVKSMEQRMVTLDGTVITTETSSYLIQFDNKPAIQSVIRDITEQKQTELALQDRQQRYMSLFEYNPDPVFLLDCHGYFKEINSAVWKTLGIPKDEVKKMSFHQVLVPSQIDFAVAQFKKALKGEPQNYEISAIKNNGDEIPVNITLVPIIIEEQVTGVFCIAKDITKEKEAVQKIKELAYTDQLTGLPNRTWFFKYFTHKLKEQKQLNHPIAILAIDFDDFKSVNDTIGHHAGDMFLQQVANRMKDILRPQDIIARLGGDEFIVFLDNITKEEVSQIAQKIINEMNNKIPLFGHEFILTLSIGISMYSKIMPDVETFIKEADFAMYYAKEKGKNNYQLFTDELKKKVNQRLKLESALRKAIDKEELELYYQPQFDIKSRDIVSAEALLRWNSSFGRISPNEFIPIAEDTGLIVSIGKWVFKEACLHIKEWRKRGLPVVPISVNVSARQFREADFAKVVQQIVKEEKIDPSQLIIEITESAMLDIVESEHIIQDLKELGIKIAIDDFGKGYSSLQIITDLNYDILKIDKSLMDIEKGNRNIAILKAVLETTKGYKEVIVEGIETQEQVDFLKTYNVVGQGFFFSHPLPSHQFEEQLKQIRG